jgi:MoxR-like ATPase
MRAPSTESPSQAVVPDASAARALLEKLLTNLELVIQGKREVLKQVLCCVSAGGHLLLEDIPGTGKTTLAKALAASAGIGFKRVQFTPDLLPTDIVGASVFHPQQGTFSFKPGPLFTHVLIADEINRASPRTQSALLEALSEQQVTVDGETHPLRSPFLCIATQNPIEFHGTYPLPEAQLDRFALQLSLGYPSDEDERRILSAQRRSHPLEALKAVAQADELVGLQRAVDEVELEESVSDYLFRVVHATRNHPSIRLGVSMRGALVLAKLARSRALWAGRAFVLPEDVKSMSVPALAHRLVLDTRARYAGADKRSLMSEVLEQVPVPR